MGILGVPDSEILGVPYLEILRQSGAPAGGYMWAICAWHMYLWGRAAEGDWGSSRRLYVGHLYLAYVLVGPPG